MPAESQAFHYAFKVKDLESTRAFYLDILGCVEGRSSHSWVDFDLYGNQLSAHVGELAGELDYCGDVDGVSVPIPHFGCILMPAQFAELAGRLERAEVKFIVKPQTRYAGEAGEQQTLFVMDYSGNPLEFKAFSNSAEVFSG